MSRRRDVFSLLFVGLVLVGLQADTVNAADPDVRVMSFNIRYGTAKDGENHWDRRKEFVADTIRAFHPDLLGTQETLGFQRDFLAASLVDYDHLGVGRDDGADRGEMMALFYRRDRFEKLDGGHFWLSETPDQIGSKSWDSSLPRMVTWVKLRDRQQPQTPLVFLNTHFDHLGPTARLESARLVRRQIAKLADGASVIVTGDFNAGEDSDPYRALFAPIDDQPSTVVDSFRVNHPDRMPNEGTITGFKADTKSNARIDWIGVSRDWQIRSAAIDRTARDGRTPSDHYPVTAILRRKSSDNAASARKTLVDEAVNPLFGGDYPVESYLDIPYFDGLGADSRKHKLDLFTPRGATDFPVLFFVHGGAWTTGDRKLYGRLGRVFARNGIGTVITSYRLSPGVKHPGHIEDVARAFAWTHKHIAKYGGRSDQIFVSGQSAGGHLAALLCTDEKYLNEHGLALKDIRGAIPISGIFTFRPGDLPFIIGRGQEAADSASPTKHVSGDEPPFLILYAASDLPRCEAMSNELRDELTKNGVEADCLQIPHRNHLTIIFQPMLGDRDTTAQTMLRFIARHSDLKLKPRGTTLQTYLYCSAAQDQALVVLRLDPQSGALTEVSRLATPGEPGGLATSPDGRFLFAAMRSTGKLASFRIDDANGSLTAINEVAAGADPAQISIDKTGQYLLTAYYVAAKVSVHRIAEDGTLSDQPVQELPTDKNAHAIVPDPTNHFVFVPHTGPNAIFQFAWNAETGMLTPHSQAKLMRPENTGPRHLAWHPTKSIAYIDNEQGSSVTAYSLGKDGSLVPESTATTLPTGFSASNSTAEIKVHPTGRFLYVSNRGHDSLAVIRIDDAGTGLEFVAAEPTEKTPRSFDIDPSGTFLLSAGESSGRLAVSRIDAASGRLTLVETRAIGAKLWWVLALQK
jgi:6-phosphogluconolactonase (cycloisomerase 2 family)/endonuclease/exonuclease/phosphatase family metal-dependent hydrolase/dienelactone hydrolase